MLQVALPKDLPSPRNGECEASLLWSYRVTIKYAEFYTSRCGFGEEERGSVLPKSHKVDYSESVESIQLWCYAIQWDH